MAPAAQAQGTTTPAGVVTLQGGVTQRMGRRRHPPEGPSGKPPDHASRGARRIARRRSPVEAHLLLALGHRPKGGPVAVSRSARTRGVLSQSLDYRLRFATRSLLTVGPWPKPS